MQIYGSANKPVTYDFNGDLTSQGREKACQSGNEDAFRNAEAIVDYVNDDITELKRSPAFDPDKGRLKLRSGFLDGNQWRRDLRCEVPSGRTTRMLDEIGWAQNVSTWHQAFAFKDEGGLKTYTRYTYDSVEREVYHEWGPRDEFGTALVRGFRWEPRVAETTETVVVRPDGSMQYALHPHRAHEWLQKFGAVGRYLMEHDAARKLAGASLLCASAAAGFMVLAPALHVLAGV